MSLLHILSAHNVFLLGCSIALLSNLVVMWLPYYKSL